MGYTPKFILFVLHFKFLHFCNIERNMKKIREILRKEFPKLKSEYSVET